MPKQGVGLENLGTTLAVAGWGLAALTVIFFLRTLLEVLSYGADGVVLPILFSLALSVVVCLALAGLGHLLRAMAQLGRNVHRLAAMIAERPAGGPPP